MKLLLSGGKGEVCLKNEQNVFQAPDMLSGRICAFSATAREICGLGTWTFEFGLDSPDNVYQGTYKDRIDVTVTP